jgi:quercetin dioxygenase-like cupin family protein
MGSRSTNRNLAATALCAAALVLCAAAPFAQDGITRADIQTHDLSAPGYQVVQQMIALQPGAIVTRHTHPGEEVTVVLEGTLQLEVAGQPSQSFTAGQGFTVPGGAVHGAVNTGSKPARILATYIVEKGKPLRGAAH